jgi:hypothetical protein
MGVQTILRGVSSRLAHPRPVRLGQAGGHEAPFRHLLPRRAERFRTAANGGGEIDLPAHNEPGGILDFINRETPSRRSGRTSLLIL